MLNPKDGKITIVYDKDNSQLKYTIETSLDPYSVTNPYVIVNYAGVILPDTGGSREFDTFPNEKQRISRMNAYIFLSNLLFLYIGFFGFLCYNGIEVKKIEGQYIKIKKR